MAVRQTVEETVCYRVAGFWQRALAGAVDGLVLLPLVVTTGAIALTLAAGVSALPRPSELGFTYAINLALANGSTGPAVLIMTALVVGLYFFVFSSLSGQTLGKRLFKIRVIDGFGETPTVGRSLRRILGYVLSALLFSLGFLWIGFDREKRGLHDWIAGTYVVQVPNPGR